MKPTMQWLWKHPFILLVIIGLCFYTYNKVHTYFARMHFDSHCENDAGEFIYKTVENVEGLYQMRLRDSQDQISNLRHYYNGTGDIHEDPYGHTNTEAQDPWSIFLNRFTHKEYEFFETQLSPTEAYYGKDVHIVEDNLNKTSWQYWRYTNIPDNEGERMTGERVPSLKSKYGFTWRETRSNLDRFFGVWGGELIVKNLLTDETLAVRKGYLAFGHGSCPKRQSWDSTYFFISKVLKPVKKD